MKASKILRWAEQWVHTVEIEELRTGKEGVANSRGKKIEVFCGSDGTTLGDAEFDRRFRVIALIGDHRFESMVAGDQHLI